MYTDIKKLSNSLDNKNKREIYKIFFLILFGVFFETLSVGMVVPVVTLLVEDNLSTKFPIFNIILEYLGNPNKKELLKYLVLFFIFIFVIKNMFLTILIWKKNSFVYSISNYYSNKLFYKYISKSYLFHVNKNSSELINNIDKETSLASGGFVYSLIDIVVETLVFSSLFILLLILEPVLTVLIFITFSAVGLLYYILFRKKILRFGYERQIWNSAKIKSLNEILRNIKFYLILNKTNKVRKDFSNILDKIKNINIKYVFLNLLPRQLFEVVILITLCTIILIFASKDNYNLKDLVPTLALLGVSAFRILPSMSKILQSFQQLKYSRSAIDVIYKELNNEKLNIESFDNNKNISFKNLLIEDLNFSYSNKDKPILKDLSLRITKGKIYGFIGSSGSGKSTLLDIIMQLLDPESGKIFLNDNLNFKEHKNWWHKSIGYVPQNIFLNDDSIKNNIALGEEESEIDEKRLKDAINKSKLDDFINNLEDGYNTNIGENGARLSGGQIQRIGIARALYADPELLFLDEITSSLDLETEAQIINDIQYLKKNKTIVIITHRSSTTKICDEIYELKNLKLNKVK